MEFGNSAQGTLTGLAVLLAHGNGRGGGDLRTDHPIIGSWAGDRIVVTGDYADEGEYLPKEPGDMAKKLKEDVPNLFDYAERNFEDVSDEVIKVIAEAEGDRHDLAAIDPDRDESRFAQILEVQREKEKGRKSQMLHKILDELEDRDVLVEDYEQVFGSESFDEVVDIM